MSSNETNIITLPGATPPTLFKPVPDCPEVYYDTGKKEYWIQNSRQDWISVNEASVRRNLIRYGFSPKRPEGAPLSPLDQRLTEIQTERDVCYAGPLAGYPKGVQELGGARVLVTQAPKLIEPCPGAYPNLQGLMQGMFGEEQLPYVKGWIKTGYECLRAGGRRPGQVLVLAGKRNSGKSLFQNLLTEVFGGRVAKPYRYMSGGTDFNRELFGAEHLMIEDEIASTDIRARRNFGARIKDFTVNEVQSCHGKGREAISLTPFWRVTISVNDEPENLLILPPFDDSIADKLMLLKVNSGAVPGGTSTMEGRKRFWKTLLDELPAMLHELTEWEIPNELKSERFGVKEYHHEDTIDCLEDSAPETKMLALIDAAFKHDAFSGAYFEGTAEELQEQLMLIADFEARRLFSWSGSAGAYLGRLASKHPDRVVQRRTRTQRLWRVNPPDAQNPG